MNKKIATVAASIALALASVTRAADLLPKVFSHPDRIRYDGQCFTIENKDTFIFSGAFHYFRCPKELWNDRFDKIKAAGFNCVETYVAWNKEEPAMPASVDDYSKVDLKDLDDWLTMAEAHGLYVILRPGPYICAEWDCGGFPQWLVTKKPAEYHTGHPWLRSDESSFVAWSNHWFHAVDQVAVKHQITHRKPGTGGIIIYQLENEYGGNQPDDVEVRYLHALGQQSLNDGIDVPFMTCWTGVVRGSADPILRQAYDSCNFYPGWNVDSIAGEIGKLDREQPDAPRETTELQGGWFGNVGKNTSLAADWNSYAGAYTPAQIQNLTLYAIEKGDRVTNYYMLFGGTNFGDFAPSGITTSYDYSAPIREVGGVGEKYQRVAAIGKMLQEHGQQFARSNLVQCTADTGFKDVTAVVRSSPDGAISTFIRTSQHVERRHGKAQINTTGITGGKTNWSLNYDLEPFGSVIYFMTPASEKWELLPEPTADIARPIATDLPAKISLANFTSKPDSGPIAWQPLPEGTPLEQFGVYDRRYIFYRTHVTITGEQLKGGPLSLSITAPRRDHLAVTINGRLDSSITGAGSHAAMGLKAGDNAIEILYENVGQPNGGVGMEEMSGVRKISVQSHTEAAADSVTGWKIQKLDSTKKPWNHTAKMPELSSDFDASTWTDVKVDNVEADQLRPKESAIFRTTLNVTAAQLEAGPRQLVVTRMDDAGWVFVNGEKVGEGHDYAQENDIPLALHEGDNSLAILIHNEDGPGGLGPVRLENGATKPGLPIEIGTESKGFDAQWSKTDEQGWTTSSASAAPLTWYRTSFELPAAKPSVWVPWVARLDLNGNAFLYLNGHALGRYWQVGPQHDFFLPECWLNFGTGKSNVLTICERRIGAGDAVKSAEVVPVNELAEVR